MKISLQDSSNFGLPRRLTIHLPTSTSSESLKYSLYDNVNSIQFLLPRPCNYFLVPWQNFTFFSQGLNRYSSILILLPANLTNISSHYLLTSLIGEFCSHTFSYHPLRYTSLLSFGKFSQHSLLFQCLLRMESTRNISHKSSVARPVYVEFLLQVRAFDCVREIDFQALGLRPKGEPQLCRSNCVSPTPRSILISIQ